MGTRWAAGLRYMASVRAWRHAGRLVRHIVDSRTGAPARSPWRIVTVAASSCVVTNVAATAAVVQGATAVHDLAPTPRPARLVDQHGRVTVVGGWPPDRRADSRGFDDPYDVGGSTPAGTTATRPSPVRGASRIVSR